MTYLKESWYMGDRWYEEWVEEEQGDYIDLEDYDFAFDPDRLEWVAPDLIEENCVIWSKE